MVEHLPSAHKALSSVPGTAKKEIQEDMCNTGYANKNLLSKTSFYAAVCYQ